MSILPNINKSISRQTVLVAPLDWGLGHATRCIPVVRALLAQQNRVLLAAEGASANLLQQEFPDLTILPLQGYRIQYANTRFGFFWKIFFQIPSILSSIRKEKKWLQQILGLHPIDWVISDNRFGLTHPSIHSVFITHQLAIQTGWKLIDRIVQRCNYFYINQFTECWVPDYAGEDNLAGSLSHPVRLPAIPLNYLGPMSRMQPAPIEKTDTLMCLVSGPEPQRSIFEQILVRELQQYSGPAILIRGLPLQSTPIRSLPSNVVQYNHLPAKELNQWMLQSKWMIARAGYSTIMDAWALQTKAIFVPTPGQTEQEYLAAYLRHTKKYYSVSQKGFSLTKALRGLTSFEEA